MHPSLERTDEELLKDLQELLNARAPGNPYSRDGQFAATIRKLPIGLRAMAATHCLDISLTLDSITWHFGNFGEPNLVALTEAGLWELGLHDLADCFREAKELMVPVLQERAEEEDPYEALERLGLRERADEIDEKAWELDQPHPGKSLIRKSVIFDAWVRYGRAHPEHVFVD